MKRLLLFVMALTCVAARGQVTVISGQAINQFGQPLPNAQVRVCSVTSTGVPCTPVASVYLDYGLTVPAANPWTADQYGNYTLYAGPLASPNLYVVQLSPASGITWSYVTAGQTCGPSGCTVGGLVTANTFNALVSPYYEINGTQISSAALSDHANLAYLNATQSFTGVDTFTQTVTAPLFVGNLNGNVTGNVTGHASLDLALSGGTLTGLLTSPTDLFSGYSFGQTTTPTNTRVSSTRTFLNPELYYGLLDTSPATYNSGAQADGRLTPALHVEINDQSPNDAGALYWNHTCTYPTGPASANGACVAFVPIAIQTSGDEHYGLEAINGICSEQATDPNVQMQCEELNVFNLTGHNSDIQANGTYTSGPLFGYSATAGGPNSMVAGFNCQDQATMTSGAGWNHCFWAERWLEDAILVGTPGGTGNGAVGLHQVAQSAATPSQNFNAIQIELDDSYYASGSFHPFASYIGTVVGTGSSPLHCLGVGFTGVFPAWDTCNDGSMNTGGQLNVFGPIIVDGTGGNNIWAQSTSATLKLGSASASATPAIKMNSSGTGSDYDVELITTGGSGTVGQGTLNIVTGALKMNGAAGLTTTATISGCTLSFVNGLLVTKTGSC